MFEKLGLLGVGASSMNPFTSNVKHAMVLGSPQNVTPELEEELLLDDALLDEALLDDDDPLLVDELLAVLDEEPPPPALLLEELLDDPAPVPSSPEVPNVQPAAQRKEIPMDAHTALALVMGQRYTKR